ncbi:long-chain acyl-CoA synthetase [Antricoccus suffuscus]|uniref:Long-chain acyl-CoA synthetase n=1 Tax=Antricoccus suffuscus TaxID=1629062 RepID=A0A2T0ZWR1_9ACTN|nr:AMP-binding protein [Antricoccus suffuscus]PRZ40724.1 long-chain acyl-CoA synthetase [Antricoccus suffuscus]
MTWYSYAESDPDRLAIVGDEVRLTFGELSNQVNQIIHALDELGVGRGDAVAIVLPNEWEYLPLELACLSTERYVVPVNRHLTAPEIAYILGNSEPKLVLTNADLLPTVREAADEAGLPGSDRIYTTGDPQSESAWSKVWAAKPTDPPQRRLSGSVMFYSSGTTGKPKGIKRALSGLTPQAESELGRETWEMLNLTTEPGVHVVAAPMYHSAPNALTLSALGRGVTIAFPPASRFDAETFLEFAQRIGMTESFMVPTMFQRLLRLPDDTRKRFDSSTIRAVVHAGAPCPVSVKQAMIEWWGPVLEEFYGSTESSVVTTVNSKQWLDAPGTVGAARPGWQIQIRGADGEPAEPGVEGLIYSLGSTPFDYVKDPDKTAATWDGNALLIGDIGKLDEQGRLFVLDRRTDLILSGGVNIYPAEIEFVLVEHPSVVDVVVIGVPDEEWGQRVVAIVQPTDEAEWGELSEELMRFCQGRLAKYKQPSRIEITEELPRMATGKISRSRVREAYVGT